MPQFRTKDELNRARWAEKYISVADGEQYSPVTDKSPFPVHEYFRNKLLGKRIKMLEVNAGLALIENMVADTMTEMHITVMNGDAEDEAAAKELWDWLDSIDYETTDEEAARDFFSTGYDVQQPVRTVDGEENGYTVVNVDPSTWYPVIPTFKHEAVTEGRIVSVFSQDSGGKKVWYAFVEHHTVGNVAYELYQLESEDAVEGKKIGLDRLPQFAGLADTLTELPYLAVFQQNRQKSSRHLFGRSVLAPIWDILQEVSEIQTQIRQERIKHFKARFYADVASLSRAENANPELLMHPVNSKQLEKAFGNLYDLSQEVFPVKSGAIVPGYIQRDLQSITIGSQEIDKLLTRAAAVAGVPKGVFNIEDKAGNVKVDTERRKDRRYVRQIIQAQKRRCASTTKILETYWRWTRGEASMPKILVTRQPPFQMNQEEVVALMREMNPDDRFVSRKEALKQIWAEKTPEELDQLEKDIEQEDQMSQPPPASVLNKIQPIQL